MKNQIKNLAQEPLERRTAPFASPIVDQIPTEDTPIDSGGDGPTTPVPEPVNYPGNSDDHRQDIFQREQ